MLNTTTQPAALLFALKYFNVQSLLRQALDWVAGLGVAGAVIFALLYILACVRCPCGNISALPGSA